jgi:hypothetical protein
MAKVADSKAPEESRLDQHTPLLHMRKASGDPSILYSPRVMCIFLHFIGKNCIFL